MKTIIVPTDFSKDASNAANYALNLAKAMRANITLCHSFIVPEETSVMAKSAWPLNDYESIKNDATRSLRILAKKLEVTEFSSSNEQDFHPEINFKSHNCELKVLVSGMVRNQNSDFLVMGLHEGGPLNRLFSIGRNRDIIADASYPVILVPSGILHQRIKKIAFASEFCSDDIRTIESLVSFARYFNAEVILVHISEATDQKDEQKVATFLNEVTNLIDYPKIYYRHIDQKDINIGLDEIAEDGTFDLLAMVHAKHNWFQQISNASRTRKIAGHIHMPLLVLPKGIYTVF